MNDPMSNIQAAGGYGPPGGGYPPGGGGYGAPPGAPPGGGGFGAPPGAPPGGYGAPPGAPPPGGYGAPPPAGFGPPGGGFPPPGGPMMPGAGGDVNTTLPLVLSIIALFPCCNLLFGGIGLAFAIQAGNAKKAGDIEGARSKAKIALIVVSIGLGLELIGGIINFVVGMANS